MSSWLIAGSNVNVPSSPHANGRPARLASRSSSAKFGPIGFLDSMSHPIICKVITVLERLQVDVKPDAANP